MNIDYTKLRGRIVERFGSLEAFARNVGSTPATVTRKLNNITPMTRDNIITWGEALSIEPDNIGVYFFNVAGASL